MLHNLKPYTVYHGTNLFSAKVIQYRGVMLNAQRDLTDFGKGFYVTPNIKQAIKWSYVKAQSPQVNPDLLALLGIDKNEYFKYTDTKIPAYLTFNINRSHLLLLNGLVFPMPDDPLWYRHKNHWKDFVQHCRTGVKHPFDFVYGPVGGSHNGTYFQVTPSKRKEQLSLNSIHALQCLSDFKITKLEPTRYDSKGISNTKNGTSHPFLQAISNELMRVTHHSYRHVNHLVHHSWVDNQINKQESILWHESPSYWAFFTLYENKELWYKDYEAYMMQRCNLKN